jgi:hypothetical protein
MAYVNRTEPSKVAGGMVAVITLLVVMLLAIPVFFFIPIIGWFLGPILAGVR